MHTVIRAVAALVLTLFGLLVPSTVASVAASASAAPAGGGDDSSYYVSGYTGPGTVVDRTAHAGSDCVTHRALLVSNKTANSRYPDRRPPEVLRRSGPQGSGWVCVSAEGYERNTMSAWWTGGVRRGPVG